MCVALWCPVDSSPEPLSACQWDMRAIGATSSGSYAVNRGRGARVGVIDTGIDLTNGDIMPNVDVAASCVFLYATTPTANPAEQVTRGDCSNKAALQDLAGHGTHTAGTIAAPINGIGIAGVAPEATIVVLKAGTEQGYFFTQSVVDALMYAGDQHLDVVNMSFFADPWLFNCRNDKEQKAIIKAISTAAQVRPAAGRACSSPPPATTASTSTIRSPTRSARTSRPARRSRDRSTTRASSCRRRSPGVVVVTATGAENLLTWYSSYGNLTDVTAPGGSRFQTPTFDPARGRVLAPYSSTASDLALEAALGRLVRTRPATTTPG